jgi:murein tripeptide amidase MpaA
MYLFDQLIQSYKTRSEFATRIPKGTAFYFIPVLNADGYEFCWTDDRYWRKNRRSNGNNRWGVDLNRNFSKGWGGQGSSSNPSSDTYRGPSAFSEPESNALRNYLDFIEPVAGFIDFHSYGQYILWPWGYQTSLSPGDAWLRALGLAMKQSIFSVNAKSYTAGPSASTLYVASGITPDYAYDRFNAAAYTIELRDTGEHGFVLPENQILPTQVETWPAFTDLVARLTVR